MAFGLLPISPAAAAIDANDACANSAEDGFTDTGLEDTDDLPNDVEDAVDCLAACNITVGQFGAVLFGTGNLVTRGQLASFVMNILDRVDGFTRPGNAFDQFPDDEGSVHEQNINDAAALGIIRGYPDGTYRPGAPVTRAQMATFLVNTLEEAGVAVPGTTRDEFTDDEQSVHESNINRLEALDIVDGEAPGIYNPERSVTRGTMSFFLTRTYELIVEGGLADPCGGNETLAISPQGDTTILCTDPSIESTTTTDQRTYTVSGLNDAEDYRITLVNGDNVSTDANGDTVFDIDPASPMGSNLALTGTVVSRIVTINGTDVTGTPDRTAGGVTSVNGTITFVVDCGGAETVTPVIYDDGGASTRLELGADGRPVEEFGTGGTITFTALPVVQNAATVTADATAVQGGTFGLNVTSADITDVASITVTGACIESQTFLAPTTTTGSLDFVVAVNASAAVGDCELTVVTTFTAASGLTAETDTVTVAITAAPDTAGPAFVSSTPTDGATGVSAAANQTATFDEALGATSTATLTCGSALVAGMSSVSTNTITFDPTTDLAASATCVATFTAVDAAGNSSTTTVDFTTTAAAPASVANPMVSATAVAGSQDLTVTFTDAVLCSSVAVGDFTFTATDGTVLTPVSVGCTGPTDATLVFTFPGTPFTNETGTVVVTADAVSRGSDSAPQTTSSIAFTTTPAPAPADTTPPDITSAAGVASANTLTVTYSEAVMCGAGAASQFSYQDATVAAASPTTVVCDGTSSVVLTFAAGELVAADNGIVTYTDDNAAALDVNDVQDASGNQAVTPESNATTIA